MQNERIARIIATVLFGQPRKSLAWRAADDYIDLVTFGLFEDLGTRQISHITKQSYLGMIGLIGRDRVFVDLGGGHDIEADVAQTRRQSSEPGKKIDDRRLLASPIVLSHGAWPCRDE